MSKRARRLMAQRNLVYLRPWVSVAVTSCKMVFSRFPFPATNLMFSNFRTASSSEEVVRRTRGIIQSCQTWTEQNNDYSVERNQKPNGPLLLANKYWILLANKNNWGMLNAKIESYLPCGHLDVLVVPIVPLTLSSRSQGHPENLLTLTDLSV